MSTSLAKRNRFSSAVSLASASACSLASSASFRSLLKAAPAAPPPPPPSSSESESPASASSSPQLRADCAWWWLRHASFRTSVFVLQTVFHHGSHAGVLRKRRYTRGQTTESLGELLEKLLCTPSTEHEEACGNGHWLAVAIDFSLACLGRLAVLVSCCPLLREDPVRDGILWLPAPPIDLFGGIAAMEWLG